MATLPGPSDDAIPATADSLQPAHRLLVLQPPAAGSSRPDAFPARRAANPISSAAAVLHTGRRRRAAAPGPTSTMPPSGHSSAAASSNIGSSAPRSRIPIGSGGTPMATAATAGDDGERRGSCGPLKRASPFCRRRSRLQIGASGSGMRMRRGWLSGGRLRPAARVTGRELRRGMWWDRGGQRFVEEGVDFIQDTEVGGGDEYEFIPASDDEDDGDVIPPDSVDQEVVPETEPQVFVAVEPEVHQVVAMEKKEGQVIDLVAKSTREDVFGEVAVKINETISCKEPSPCVFDVGKEDCIPMVEEKRISEDDPYADVDWRGYSQEYEFDEVVFDMGRALMPGYTQIWKECAKKRKRN